MTKSLQTKDCNIADAYHDVALAKDYISDVRNDECWEKVWNRIEQVAASVNITTVKPRTANIQGHRANAAASLGVDQKPSDYHKITVYYHFIDQVIRSWRADF